MDAKYVLCVWKGCFWPAKVLSRPRALAQQTRKRVLSLEVQILSVDEKIRVKRTKIKTLKLSMIESITTSLAAHPEPSAPEEEEMTYICAITMAWDLLNKNGNYTPARVVGDPESKMQSPRRLQKQHCRSHQGPSQGLRRSVRKRKSSKSPVVPSEREEAPYGDKSQVCTLVALIPSNMKTESSQSPRVHPNFPSLSEDCHEKEGKEKGDASKVMSLPLYSEGEDVDVRGGCMLPSLTSGFIPTVHKALEEGAHNTCQKSLAVYPEHATSSGNVDPEEGTCNSGSEGSVASSSAPNLSLNYSLHLANRKRKLQAPGCEEEWQESQLSAGSKAIKPTSAIKKGGGKEVGQLTSMVFPGETCPIERGMLVWFKFQNHPFWPAVIKSVSPTQQTARVLLIEAKMSCEKSGIQVPLRRLKHLDYNGKEKLMKRASKLYRESVNWCFSLISSYREGLVCGSFVGSFLDYYAADISYPMRKAIQEGDLQMNFPKVNYSDLEDSEEETSVAAKRHCKRILPDWMRAARDRANQKLVDFIVKRKGADSHLLDIIKGRKGSKWLESFMKSERYVICVETYLEDDDQLDVVLSHLREIYKHIDKKALALTRDDPVSFLLEVLLPEVIICSVATVDGLDYKEAEAKYRQGPPVYYREKELFDQKILKKLRKTSTERYKAKLSPFAQQGIRQTSQPHH
ncbi:unnamed protein product [Rangifer tarandus platyrhynchus]|uniref:Uncharacterized protein n=1 Tax=Rangifer tarandus platyrhynchus TaxID=3082113 RepID=A0ABN9A7M2_RANTA|nr:unnamed protein product [Rangifer tarandus platyrhynchus]